MGERKKKESVMREEELTAHIVCAVFHQQFHHLHVLVINNMENTFAIFASAAHHFHCHRFSSTSFFFHSRFSHCFVLYHVSFAPDRIYSPLNFFFYFFIPFRRECELAGSVCGWTGYHFCTVLSPKCVICFVPIWNNGNSIFSQPMSFNVDTNEIMHI